MSLTEEQRSFVDLVLKKRPRLCCLTGGPGTGKSYVTAALAKECTRAGLTAVFAAPTGKAALRMQQLSGYPASTIHSLLGIRPGAPRDPFPQIADVLVIDESSMVDVELMAALMGACEHVGTLVLVGDADQLPPVGPGAPFLTILKHGLAPTVRLTQVHRQAQDSGIVSAAYAIRDGRPPAYNDTDFVLVRCAESEDLNARVLSLCIEHSMEGSLSQVLIPQGPGPAGHRAFNALVESRHCPVEELVRKQFRVGTKVINTKNDRSLDLLNGEIGVVTEAHRGAEESGDSLTVRFDSGESAYFSAGKIKQLLPAWAITVHRSQGSEWDDVVVVAHRTHSRMLTRALLYVAVTRACNRVFVVGTPGAVTRAVAKTTDLRRHTMLDLWAHEQGAA